MPPRKYRKSNSPYARPAPAIATSSTPPQATGTVTTHSHAPTIDVVTSSPAPVPPTDATRITQKLVQDTAGNRTWKWDSGFARLIIAHAGRGCVLEFIISGAGMSVCSGRGYKTDSTSCVCLHLHTPLNSFDILNSLLSSRGWYFLRQEEVYYR